MKKHIIKKLDFLEYDNYFKNKFEQFIKFKISKIEKIWDDNFLIISNFKDYFIYNSKTNKIWNYGKLILDNRLKKLAKIEIQSFKNFEIILKYENIKLISLL